MSAVTRASQGRVAGAPSWLAAAGVGVLLGSVGCQPTADGAPDFNEPAGPGQGGSSNPNNGNNPVRGGEGVSPQSTDTGLTPAGTPLADCGTPGPQALRRLTAPQYRNTLVSLFGDQIFDASAPEQGVLTDSANLGFKVDADALVVSNLDSELLMNYAEAVVTKAASSGKFNDYTNGCTDVNRVDCRQTFIKNLGEKAYRQPLNNDQVQAYDGLFMADYAGTSFDERAQTVAIAMLQSPNMLYRREIGDSGSAGQFNLTPFEVASQLSYLLTDAPPDGTLMDLAKNGSLTNRDVLDAQAERLMDSPAGRETLADFLDGWVETEKLYDKAKDTNTFNLTPTLRTAMLTETHLLFQDAFANGGNVETLFTADYTFVNQELAQFYGIPFPGGDGFQRVPVPANRAPGILGQAAYLTSHAQPENSSPVQRAFIVRERLLCQDLPPVPQNLDTNLDAPAGFTTNRERYFEHSSNQVCYTCHQRMDPIGFSFEHYDGFGRYRDTENGAPVDSTGQLSDVPGGPIPLTGVADLAEYLATSELVQSCVVRYWSYYAYGRDTWESKQCNHDAIRREALADGFSLKSVLKGIIHAQQFSTRVQVQ